MLAPAIFDPASIAPTALGDSMTKHDQDLWACALWLEKALGEEGTDYIGRQVRHLALKGDRTGVTVWLGIAERYDALRRPAVSAS